MSEDPMTNSFVRTTTALTMFNAGVKENVVPQRVEAKVNFRLLPGDTPEAVIVSSLLAATTDTRHYIDLADNQHRF
jgi:carboxypeptidase PM20D1